MEKLWQCPQHTAGQLETVFVVSTVSLPQFDCPVNDSEFYRGLEASQSSLHTFPLAIRKGKPQWLTTSFLRKEATQSYILNMLSGNTLNFLTHLL